MRAPGNARFEGDRLHEEVLGRLDANVAASRNAAEMKAKVLAQYPGLGMEFTPNDRVATYFPAAKQ
jgi:hypothetical protein